LELVKFSEWTSLIVIIPKKNDSIRICIDCKVTINKFIQTHHYPLPNIEDLFASMSGCAMYCVLDLSGAYQQLELSTNSREYLTINTLKGLFRFTRLTFGVASAPAIFQSTIDQILLGSKNVFCYLDDILIGEETVEKCKQNLELVLDKLNKFNVSINLDKCKFRLRVAQTVKKYILDSELRKLSIKEKIVRFITVYNTTPITVTAQSQDDRMFSYKLRSIMSSINPKSNITASEKKIKI